MISTGDFHPLPLTSRLEELHIELVELAYTLERQGRAEAADVAIAAAGRVGEILRESTRESCVRLSGGERSAR